ncbi:hypothetical protein ACJX0J_028955 [Zea mays]
MLLLIKTDSSHFLGPFLFLFVGRSEWMFMRSLSILLSGIKHITRRGDEEENMTTIADDEDPHRGTRGLESNVISSDTGVPHKIQNPIVSLSHVFVVQYNARHLYLRKRQNILQPHWYCYLLIIVHIIAIFREVRSDRFSLCKYCKKRAMPKGCIVVHKKILFSF